MRIIGFGSKIWQLIYLFGASCLYVGNLYCRILLGEKWLHHYLIRSLISFFGQIILGLLSFINFSRRQREEDNNNIRYTSVETFTIIQQENRNGLGYFYLIIKNLFSCILMNISNYSLAGVALWVPMFIQIIILITLSIFSYFFLGYHYNRHHFFSFCIIFISFALIVISSYSEFNHVILLFITIFATCLPAAGEVLDKWLMEHRHFTPYRIVLIEGIVNVLITSLLIVITNYIPCIDEFAENNWCEKGSTIESFESFKLILIDYTWAYLILMMICYGIFVLLRKLVIFHYTPGHRCIINIQGMSLYWICHPVVYEDYALYQKVLLFSGCFVAFIGYLLYNQIIVVHLCKMSQNTIVEIKRRGKQQENNYQELEEEQ